MTRSTFLTRIQFLWFLCRGEREWEREGMLMGGYVRRSSPEMVNIVGMLVGFIEVEETPIWKV